MPQPTRSLAQQATGDRRDLTETEVRMKKGPREGYVPSRLAEEPSNPNRARIAGGVDSNRRYLLSTFAASSTVVESPTVGPEAITLKSSPITSERMRAARGGEEVGGRGGKINATEVRREEGRQCGMRWKGKIHDRKAKKRKEEGYRWGGMGQEK